MRRNNANDMTITEQISVIKTDTCSYACKFLEKAKEQYDDIILRKIKMQEACYYCPLNKLHYMK